MPGFAGHLTAGALAGVGVALAVPQFTVVPVNEAHLITLSLATVFGALWPDVDTASTSRKYIYCFFLALAGFLFYQREFVICSVLGIIGMLPMIGNHRGWTHNIFGGAFIAAVMSAPIYFVMPTFAALIFCAVFIGFLTHIILDSF